MTDYKKLVEALRVDPFEVESEGLAKVMNAAADAIEKLVTLYEKAEIDATNLTGKLAQAEAQLPKRGEWVWKHRHHGGFKTAKGKCECGRDVYAQIDERYETDDPYCPFCGVMNDSIHLNYCPNCGADMRAKMEVQDG